LTTVTTPGLILIPAILFYRPDGSRYKYVRNHISRSDSEPDTVDLPAGQYYIIAQGDFAPRVRVLVKIMPGHTTFVNLEHGIG
jgi:hypothetical protein